MKKAIFLFFIFSIFLMPVSQVSAQDIPNVFDMTKFPQWAKDLRRFDIITFGVFPFAVFFTTITMDTIRWYNEGNKFTDNRYAPWPIKSAGAVEMTTDEQFRKIMIAAGVSVTIALVDFLIVKLKRRSERLKIQSRAASTYEIEKIPVNPVTEESGEEFDADDIVSGEK